MFNEAICCRRQSRMVHWLPGSQSRDIAAELWTGYRVQIRHSCFKTPHRHKLLVVSTIFPVNVIPICMNGCWVHSWCRSLGSHTAGDVSHIHGGRLPLLSTRPPVTFLAAELSYPHQPSFAAWNKSASGPKLPSWCPGFALPAATASFSIQSTTPLLGAFSVAGPCKVGLPGVAGTQYVPFLWNKLNRSWNHKFHCFVNCNPKRISNSLHWASVIRSW